MVHPKLGLWLKFTLGSSRRTKRCIGAPELGQLAFHTVRRLQLKVCDCPSQESGRDL